MPDDFHMFYNRHGEPVSMEQWVELRKDWDTNFRVAQTMVGAVCVSTVCLGVNWGHPNGIPMIFETMTFSKDPKWDSYTFDRYSTEEQARDGHTVCCIQVAEDLGIEEWTETADNPPAT